MSDNTSDEHLSTAEIAKASTIRNVSEYKHNVVTAVEYQAFYFCSNTDCQALSSIVLFMGVSTSLKSNFKSVISCLE